MAPSDQLEQPAEFYRVGDGVEDIGPYRVSGIGRNRFGEVLVHFTHASGEEANYVRYTELIGDMASGFRRTICASTPEEALEAHERLRLGRLYMFKRALDTVRGRRKSG